MHKEFDITPIPKPRMTQCDKWGKRDVVQRYWAFKKEVRALRIDVENGDGIQFTIPMPESWSKKKKREMEGQPHQQTPDIDNLLKALLDAIYDDDCHIYKLSELEKIWGIQGKIRIARA